ncbi:MAG: hypothetical protein ABIV51_00795 [Saprospiraceae bacterium]
MSGKFYFYGEDQTVFCTSEYKNGMRDGITYKYHKNGKISEKYSYRLGKIDGIGEEYYEDGKLMSRYSYKQGKLDGAGTRYFANGNISNLSNYDRGMKVGKLLSFLDDGKVKGIEYYFKDSLYFQKIYKFSSNQVCIDSHEFVRPLISIGGNFVKGGLLIVNMKVITEGIPYDRDSFYVKFDMDYKDEKSGFFPYPRLIQTFVGKEEISHTYVIDSIRPGLSLYGSLEYHRTDGSIFDSDDFEYPLRRSGD